MDEFAVVFDDPARRWLDEHPKATDRRILLDPKIMPRMPQRIPVTVGGLGPFRGLHLDFSGDEWARLLYDAP
jgi:hypothetical protein